MGPRRPEGFFQKARLIGELSAQLTERLLLKRGLRQFNLSGLSGHLPYEGRLATCGLGGVFQKARLIGELSAKLTERLLLQRGLR